MTGMELFREIGMVDEKYIVEAQETRRSIIHNVVFRRSFVAAACLMICIGLYFGMKHTANESADMSANTNSAGVSYEVADCYIGDDEGIVEQEHVEMQDTMKQPMINDVEETLPDGTPRENLPQTESVVLGADKLDEEKQIQDLIEEKEALVLQNGEVQSGMDMLQDFMEDVEASKESKLNIIQYTAEGAEMIISLTYTGTDFKVLVDASHNESLIITESSVKSSYMYMQILEEDNIAKIVLSNKENLTAEKLQSEDKNNYIVVAEYIIVK